MSMETPKAPNFIRSIISAELEKQPSGKEIVTRFPPEPNGYLHIGHAKSICLNFGVAQEFGGHCNLRFDDTNPAKEEDRFVQSIKEDVKWLGFEWGESELYASDYFDRLYTFAVSLIKKGKAFVDDLNADEIRQYRGTLTGPGRESPFRTRSVADNLDLFERMRAGEYPNGSKVLRAKIDMSSPNLNMRDPVMYRILHTPHHRTGDKWCIYPMYDWAHGQSDAIEGISHSLCTVEFEAHRPLYDWFLEQLDISHPRQIEFAPMNLSYTVLSKRRFVQLVNGGHVSGWDDPRMPTIAGLRRRGYTPKSIRHFCDLIGVAKRDSRVQVALLEHSIREDLNQHAERRMAVLEPIRLVIENYPEDVVEELEAVNNPEDPEAGKRKVPFSRVLYIEQNDFREDAPKKFFRLAPGKEVRLRYAYIIKCEDVIKDSATGEIVELRCSYDPETKSGSATSARKVKGTIHWVSAEHAIDAEVRLYDRLFNVPDPSAEDDLLAVLNSESLRALQECKLEPSLADIKPGQQIQFERLGYFCLDEKDSLPEKPVFNRTVPLRDSWAKIEKAQKQASDQKK